MPIFDMLLDRLVRFVGGEPRRLPPERRAIALPAAASVTVEEPREHDDEREHEANANADIAPVSADDTPDEAMPAPVIAEALPAPVVAEALPTVIAEALPAPVVVDDTPAAAVAEALPAPVERDPELEALIATALDEVPKAVAAGVVDIASSELLGYSTVDSHPLATLEHVADATREMFAIPYFAAIEHGDPAAVSQVIVVSTNLVHVFIRLESRAETVLVIVCRTDGNLGLVLTRLRAIC